MLPVMSTLAATDAPAMTIADRTSEAPTSESPHLSLLGGFELTQGQRVVTLPASAQRLLAMVALHDRPISRLLLAGTLWPDKDEARAAANLRSSLWRLRQPGVELVRAVGDRIGLHPGLIVDVRCLGDMAWRILDGAADPATTIPVELVSGDLLPDWYDDWVLIEQERIRQTRLHALERLCRDLSSVGRSAAAVEAGLLAVRCDPLRESAHRALIEAHLAEGNRSEAIRQLTLLERLLQAELGIDAPRDLRSLCEAATSSSVTSGSSTSRKGQS